MLLVSLFFGPAETHSVTDNWTWLGPLWSSPSPWVNCYAIWYLENPPQVSLWYCTVAPVDLFTQDRNCTEGWLGPMWSSPSRYFDTCNLTFGPLLLILNVSSSLYRVKSCTKDTGVLCYPSSTVSGFGLPWIEKTSSVLVGRRCHSLLSTRRRAWGPIRSSPHASVNTLGCLICLLLLPKVLRSDPTKLASSSVRETDEVKCLRTYPDFAGG